MPSQSTLKVVFLGLLMVNASLTGCYGQDNDASKNSDATLIINSNSALNSELRTGEWNDFTLSGQGKAISVPNEVMLFINGSVIPNGYAIVQGEAMHGRLLPTPYIDMVRITVVDEYGKGTSYEIDTINGTPIIDGGEWFEKMEFITSVCSDSSECGGYINRWMGSPNPAFERAASFFHGHFAGLGYETNIMRVTDTLSITEPESLNIIAWKRGYDDSCVQGIGAHMDVALPGGPPSGGTYEGAYDNTAGTVAIMLYAKAFVDVEVRCDTFLALWSSEEAGLRGSNAFANNDCDYCLPKDKELRFYINMDMMGISYPAKNADGIYFPYHAWSGPDIDPDVQDVAITSILDHVHRDILKAPMDLRIDGSYGAGCEQHWDEHHNLVMDVHEDTFGRSDHVTFRNLGAQTIFHLGAYDEDYSAYHSPFDTLDNMVNEVGGQEELEKSIQYVMWAAMIEFFLADQTPEVANVNS